MQQILIHFQEPLNFELRLVVIKFYRVLLAHALHYFFPTEPGIVFTLFLNFEQKCTLSL